MKFLCSFLECLLGLGIIGGTIWGSFLLRIVEGDIGHPAFLYFICALAFYMLIFIGIILVVEAFKREK